MGVCTHDHSIYPISYSFLIVTLIDINIVYCVNDLLFLTIHIILPFAIGICIIHADTDVNIEYCMLLKIACVLSHAHFIMNWDGFYDRAFVNICENHVLCWCATTLHGGLNKPFQRPSRIIYITMGCPCLLIWE